MHWQKGTITRIETLSPRVKSFFFRLPQPFGFRPGQHVLVRLTAPPPTRYETEMSVRRRKGPPLAGFSRVRTVSAGRVNGWLDFGA